MLATGHVLRSEVFSYTANGAPWIYPKGAGLLFQLLYQLGGLRLDALLSAIVGASIALILVRKGGLLRCSLAALAVPVVMVFTMVRANMFTVLLAAVFLAILYDGEETPGLPWNRPEHPLKIWLLPPLMILWVNLHPGFIYGLLLLFAFAFLQRGRLIGVSAATLLATFANPWGFHVYDGIFNQNLSMQTHRAFINEWVATRVTPQLIGDALICRGVWTSWWLMGITLAAVVCGMSRKRFVGPLLLIAAAGMAIAYVRFQGLFAVAAVSVVPHLMPEIEIPRLRPALYSLLFVCIAFGDYNLAAGRRFFSRPLEDVIAPGIGSWEPERAARFVEAHRLPREIYNEYGTGGFVLWSLTPRYPVFIDGRALPYGDQMLVDQQDLGGLPPDSPQWKAAFQRYHMRTFLLSLDRGLGYGGIPLREACQSPLLKLVHLDEASAVFVTTADAPANLPELKCKTAKLPPPRPHADRYTYWSNAAHLYHVLERWVEAESAAVEGLQIAPNDADFYVELGNARDQESDFRHAAELQPGPGTWGEYGNYMMRHERYNEARLLFERAAARSFTPHSSFLSVAGVSLAAGRPKVALEYASRAIQASPFVGSIAAAGRGFTAQAHGVRGEALLSLLRIPEAVKAFEIAVQTAPAESQLQQHLSARLADAYYQAGRNADAKAAMSRAGTVNPGAKQVLEWWLTIKQ